MSETPKTGFLATRPNYYFRCILALTFVRGCPNNGFIILQVLVWHTQTIQASSDNENSTLNKYGLNSSLFEEV